MQRLSAAEERNSESWGGAAVAQRGQPMRQPVKAASCASLSVLQEQQAHLLQAALD